MGKQSARISGLRELGNALQALGVDMTQRTARSATAAGARVIADRAIELAPVAAEPYEIEGVQVEPGNIGENIVVKRAKPAESAHTSEHLVVVRGGAKHGHARRVAVLQEFGTVKMVAQAFMRPAFEQEKGNAAAAIIAKVRQRVDNAARKAKKAGKK